MLDRVRSRNGRRGWRADAIEVGLVNNMPDAALEATERQFRDLLKAAAGTTAVRLRLFSIPEVPRSDAARRQMSGRYSSTDALWNTRLDGIIVTGTEPRAADLRDEPYWATLTKVVDWADENTASSVWSCLAAHAVVLHADGIGRHTLPEKRFGVFDCTSDSAHPMLGGTASRLQIPHSRCNDLREDALTACGYRILSASREAGVDMFAKQRNSLALFFQGHPEYDAASLLREYRRDIGRFLRGERESYPSMPAGYFDAHATATLNAFRERALIYRHDDLLGFFPMSAVEAGLANPWRVAAVAIYRNWLLHLGALRAARQQSASWSARPWPQRTAIPAFASPANRTAGQA